MEKITALKAREILDSRGDPTVEVEIRTENVTAIASVPSGKSVGSHEAVELRDGDENRFGGMGVLKAVDCVNSQIAPVIIGQNVLDQRSIDKMLISLDATEHKSNLGANAILGVSISVCKAAAMIQKKNLYSYVGEISEVSTFKLPIPMFKFLDGAKHAGNNLEIQEYLVILDAPEFKENYRMASELLHKLKGILIEKKLGIGVGDEGGFAPMLSSDEEALKLISSLGNLKIALDLAGVVPKNLSLDTIIGQYPIASIEDPVQEDDLVQWSDVTSRYGEKIMIVGDDVFATNINRLKIGIDKKIANSVLVKPNQIGTVSETIDFVRMAKQNNYKVVVSHRSGETEDTFIADFAVGVSADYVKFGATARGERVNKYNRLLRIEEQI